MGLDGKAIGRQEWHPGYSRVASQAECNLGLIHQQTAEQVFQRYEGQNEACYQIAMGPYRQVIGAQSHQLSWIPSMPSLSSLQTQSDSTMYDSRNQANKELWHRRSGHLGYDNLFKLKNKLMVECISMPAQGFKEQPQQRPFCEACTLAKQPKLPLQDSDSKCSRLLELVHMDVCGPLQVTSHGDVRYVAILVDPGWRMWYQ